MEYSRPVPVIGIKLYHQQQQFSVHYLHIHVSGKNKQKTISTTMRLVENKFCNSTKSVVQFLWLLYIIIIN